MWWVLWCGLLQPAGSAGPNPPVDATESVLSTREWKAASRWTRPPTPTQTEEIIARLNGDDFRDRETAEDELVGLGEEVRDALVAQLKGQLPPETQSRLTSALHRIDEQLDVGPTMIRLPPGESGMRDALESAMRAAGWTIDPRVYERFTDWGTIKSDGRRTPALEVLRQIFDAYLRARRPPDERLSGEQRPFHRVPRHRPFLDSPPLGDPRVKGEV
jgi:hypothetical protein